MISLAFAIVVTTICEIDGTILTCIFTNNPSAVIKEAPILPIAKTLKITVNTPIHPPQYIYKRNLFF